MAHPVYEIVFITNSLPYPYAKIAKTQVSNMYDFLKDIIVEKKPLKQVHRYF